MTSKKTSSTKKADAPAAPAAQSRDQEHVAALGRRRIDESDLEASKPEDDTPVMVRVPVAFKLHHPAGTITDYAAGVYEMPTHHAEHVYSVSNGVEPYKK